MEISVTRNGSKFEIEIDLRDVRTRLTKYQSGVMHGDFYRLLEQYCLENGITVPTAVRLADWLKYHYNDTEFDTRCPGFTTYINDWLDLEGSREDVEQSINRLFDAIEGMLRNYEQSRIKYEVKVVRELRV